MGNKRLHCLLNVSSLLSLSPPLALPRPLSFQQTHKSTQTFAWLQIGEQFASVPLSLYLSLSPPLSLTTSLSLPLSFSLPPPEYVDNCESYAKG